MPHVNAAIVLGAKVGTPVLTGHENVASNMNYYQEGKTNMIVLSGAQGRGENMIEAHAMKLVILRDVKRNHIRMPRLILEQQSVLFQNIHNSKMLIPGSESVMIVNDDHHLARAVLLAKRGGFRHVYWGAPSPSYYSSRSLSSYYAQEMIGMSAYVPKFIAN